MSLGKIYFGHPVNTYDTELEAVLLAAILKCAPGCPIENPNQKKHQDGYERWKEKTGNGMSYFIKEVIPFCQLGVFLPFRDGKWGAGVYREMKAVARNTHMVWQINHNGETSRVHIEDIIPLSVEETRKRVRTSTGDRVPY